MKPRMVVGLDEVGAGAFAGPLVIVAAGFTGERPYEFEGLTDSKAMPKVKREKLFPVILEKADFIGFGWAPPEHIDLFGLAACWQTAASMAVEGIDGDPGVHLMVDGARPLQGFNGCQSQIVKGDLKHWQISAASVVAKVSRDREMIYLSEFYPGYGWGSNSGYGSKNHQKAILKNGACPQHRLTFLRKMLRSPGSSA